MKNYACKKCTKGKTAYGTPSRFRANSAIKKRNLRNGSKKIKTNFKNNAK